jgi:predicted CoA-binding protein
MQGDKQAFVEQSSLAVVGVSRRKDSFGNLALKELRKRGYRVFPVNSQADEVENEPCYRSVQALPEPVGGAVVVVPPAHSAAVVEACADAGISRVWLQQGAESQEALAAAQARGVDVIHNACILMYARPTGFHKLHRWVWKLLGKLD